MTVQSTPHDVTDEKTFSERLQSFPWWLLIIVGALLFMAYQISVNPEYDKAFDAIIPGIYFTVFTTILSFVRWRPSDWLIGWLGANLEQFRFA